MPWGFLATTPELRGASAVGRQLRRIQISELPLQPSATRLGKIQRTQNKIYLKGSPGEFQMHRYLYILRPPHLFLNGCADHRSMSLVCL